MKGLIIKADRQVLSAVSWYVRRWIERKDKKKHKIDFMILFEWCQLAFFVLWALTLPAAMYVIAGDEAGAAIHVAMWSALGVMEWLSIQYTIRRLKPLHDWFWALRETPQVYEMEKEMCETLFEKGRSERLLTNAGIMGVTLALFLVFWAVQKSGDPNLIVWQYLFVNAVANMIRRYITYVFDFDPPKKRKKASDSISELVQRLWGQLTGGFVPQPSFAS